MASRLAWIHAILSTTPARWQSLTAALPEELALRKPSPEEWSARECLLHLLDTERFVFPARLRALLAGQDFPGFDPDAEGTIDADTTTAELAAELARLRTDHLLLFGQVTEADLGRTGRHAELGPVSLDQLLHEWAAHDLNHTIQGERAVMQPFIVGCGPWRAYFKTQDISN